ncbi:MAG TPA: hypothetical protein VIS74_05070 [Chthoniobacterales bacterium]
MAALPWTGLAAYGANLAEQIKLARTDSDSNAEIELLRRSLDQNPNDAAARERLVRLWLEVRDFAMAETALAEWKGAPPEMTVWVRAQILAEREGKLAEAIASLRESVKLSPRHWENRELLAAYLGRAVRWEEQIQVLGQLLAERPDSTHYLSRAEARKRLEDYAGAILDARAAQKLSPDGSRVKATVPGYERLAQVLPVIDSTTRQLQTQPENVDLLLARGAALQYGEVPRRALTDAEAALKQDPGSAYAILLKARALLASGQKPSYELADEYPVNLSAPVESPPIAEGLIRADAAVRADPKNAAAWAQRAQRFNADQQSRRALLDAQKALSLDGKNPAALLEAIYAAGKSGDPDAAADYFRRLEQVKPPDETLALALATLVESSFAATNFQQAVEFADRALKLRETESLLRYKAQALRRLGYDEEAEAVMTRAEKLKGKAKP